MKRTKRVQKREKMNQTMNKQHEIAKGTLLELQIKKGKRLKKPKSVLS